MCNSCRKKYEKYSRSYRLNLGWNYFVGPQEIFSYRLDMRIPAMMLIFLFCFFWAEKLTWPKDLWHQNPAKKWAHWVDLLGQLSSRKRVFKICRLNPFPLKHHLLLIGIKSWSDLSNFWTILRYHTLISFPVIMVYISSWESVHLSFIRRLIFLLTLDLPGLLGKRIITWLIECNQIFVYIYLFTFINTVN